MKSLNKTKTPIFLPEVCSLFWKAIFLTFIRKKATAKRAHGCLFKKYSYSWVRSSALEAVKEGRRDKNRRSLLDLGVISFFVQPIILLTTMFQI